MQRWTLVAAIALAAPAVASAQAPASALARVSPNPVAGAPEHVVLPAGQGRSVDVSVWRSPRARGVVVFGHGFGGNPQAYHRIIRTMVVAGYSVAAPLSVDSFAGPLKGKVDPKQAFMTRVEDLMIVRGYVARHFRAQPVVLAGHSFGSLIAMIGAGATTPAGALGGPPIAGVIAFSSAGSVPGLIGPDSFKPIAVPMLIVTGDADTVPGFVADWHDHRRAFDESLAGDKTLIVVRGGHHDLVAKSNERAVAPVAAAVVDFLDAYAGHEKAARRRLIAIRSTAGMTVEHR